MNIGFLFSNLHSPILPGRHGERYIHGASPVVLCTDKVSELTQSATKTPDTIGGVLMEYVDKAFKAKHYQEAARLMCLAVRYRYDDQDDLYGWQKAHQTGSLILLMSEGKTDDYIALTLAAY